MTNNHGHSRTSQPLEILHLIPLRTKKKAPRVIGVFGFGGESTFLT